MLVKVEDGFYLNTRHIIAIHISKNASDGYFEVNVEYTPHNVQSNGLFHKKFSNKSEAEQYLQNLHHEIAKS